MAHSFDGRLRGKQDVLTVYGDICYKIGLVNLPICKDCISVVSLQDLGNWGHIPFPLQRLYCSC